MFNKKITCNRNGIVGLFGQLRLVAEHVTPFDIRADVLSESFSTSLAKLRQNEFVIRGSGLHRLADLIQFGGELGEGVLQFVHLVFRPFAKNEKFYCIILGFALFW